MFALLLVYTILFHQRKRALWMSLHSNELALFNFGSRNEAFAPTTVNSLHLWTNNWNWHYYPIYISIMECWLCTILLRFDNDKFYIYYGVVAGMPFISAGLFTNSDSLSVILFQILLGKWYSGMLATVSFIYTFSFVSNFIFCSHPPSHWTIAMHVWIDVYTMIHISRMRHISWYLCWDNKQASE